MPTVHCITLNTAVDHIIEIGELTPGTTIRSISSVHVAAGKGVDVAVGVARLGAKASAIGFVGNGSRELFRGLAQEAVDVRFLDVPGMTRTNVTILESCGRETHFQTSGYSIHDDAEHHLIDVLRTLVHCDDVVVIAGSVPEGATPEILRTLVKLCKTLCAYVILDSSGPHLRIGVEGAPQMIKPNLLELRQLVGHEIGKSDTDVIAAGRECLTSGVERVVVSRGRLGLVLVEANAAWKAFVDLHNAGLTAGVGSGDAVVAAFAVGAITKQSLSDTLRLAASCGAANVLTKLPGRFTVEDVENLLPKVEVERLY